MCGCKTHRIAAGGAGPQASPPFRTAARVAMDSPGGRVTSFDTPSKVVLPSGLSAETHRTRNPNLVAVQQKTILSVWIAHSRGLLGMAYLPRFVG